jgi:hypothetical protein
VTDGRHRRPAVLMIRAGQDLPRPAVRGRPRGGKIRRIATPAEWLILYGKFILTLKHNRTSEFRRLSLDPAICTDRFFQECCGCRALAA